MVEDGRWRFGDDPYVAPLSERDPATRLRGRLAAPVTVWTTYDESGEAVGVTISSLVVLSGDHPAVLGVLQPLSEFWEAAQESGRFVVHVLPAGELRLAEAFAGRYPGASPFPPATARSDWGPVLPQPMTRAYCRPERVLDEDGPVLVRAAIDDLELQDDADPLVHFRGRYFSLAPPH